MIFQKQRNIVYSMNIICIILGFNLGCFGVSGQTPKPNNTTQVTYWLLTSSEINNFSENLPDGIPEAELSPFNVQTIYIFAQVRDNDSFYYENITMSGAIYDTTENSINYTNTVSAWVGTFFYEL